MKKPTGKQTFILYLLLWQYMKWFISYRCKYKYGIEKE